MDRLRRLPDNEMREELGMLELWDGADLGLLSVSDVIEEALRRFCRPRR